MEIMYNIALALVWTEMSKEVLFELKLKSPSWMQWWVTKLYCLRCATFWMTLATTHDLYAAALASGAVILAEKIFESFGR